MPIALAIGLTALLMGCSEQNQIERFDFSQDRADVSESRQLQHDFYTCARYDEQTDQFYDRSEIYGPQDDILIAVADLARDEKRARLVIELIAPNEELVEQETRKYRSGSRVGVMYDVGKLIRDGGYGQWRINFYGDTLPVGYTDFWILENPEHGPPTDQQQPRDLPEDFQGDYTIK
jgi:hypothetical protein